MTLPTGALRRLEQGFWAIGIAGLSAGVLVSIPAPARGDPSPVPPSLPATPAWAPSTDSLENAVSVIEAGNLFRSDRVSATESEPEARAPSGQPPVPPNARPQLSLRGLVGGPPWDAIIDGIPGRDGPVVLRSGQPTAGFTLHRVRHDTAIIHSPDTIWKLTLRRTW